MTSYGPSSPYGSASYGSFVQPSDYTSPPPQQQGGGPYGYPPNQTNYNNYGYNYPPPQEQYAQEYAQGGKPPTIDSIESGPSGYEHHQDQTKFMENTGWRDPTFFIIFLIQLLLVAVIFICGMVTYHTGAGASEDRDHKPLPEVFSGNDVILYFLLVALVCSAAGGLLAYLWLLAVQLFAKYLIKAAMIFTVVLFFALSVVSFVAGALLSGIFLALMGGLMIFFYFMWLSRIKFATAMLKLCGFLVQKYPATARVAYLAVVIQFLWIAFWIATIGLVQQYTPALSIILSIFLIFGLYWTCQVIKNVVHVTGAGTFATWYFMEGTVGVPPNPTLKSLKRACTTSIGSICLGSMIVALIKTIRALCNWMRFESDNIVLYIIGCIAVCILDMIDALMQYFNTYAFAQIAIYGKTYCQAARDTWDLVHSHGVEAIINDNLIGNVTGMACFVSGAAVGTLGAVLAYLLRDHLGGDYWIEMFILFFFVGFLIVMITLEVVESAVVTIFVCFAEDPHALKRNSPKLYKKLKDTYEERCTLFD